MQEYAQQNSHVVSHSLIYIYIFFCFTKYCTNENRKYYKEVLQLYKSVSLVPFLLKLITSK